MSTQAEAASSVFDIIKQVISLVIVVSGLAAFYYFSDFPLLYRSLAMVAVVLISIAIFMTTATGGNVWGFMLESKQEVRKVVWPTREETTRTTLMVFVMVFLVGLILWVLDGALFWAVKLLTGQGG